MLLQSTNEKTIFTIFGISESTPTLRAATSARIGYDDTFANAFQEGLLHFKGMQKLKGKKLFYFALDGTFGARIFLPLADAFNELKIYIYPILEDFDPNNFSWNTKNDLVLGDLLFTLDVINISKVSSSPANFPGQLNNPIQCLLINFVDEINCAGLYFKHNVLTTVGDNWLSIRENINDEYSTGFMVSL